MSLLLFWTGSSWQHTPYCKFAIPHSSAHFSQLHQSRDTHEALLSTSFSALGIGDRKKSAAFNINAKTDPITSLGSQGLIRADARTMGIGSEFRRGSHWGRMGYGGFGWR